MKLAKSQTAKPNGKSPPDDKTFGIEPDICFCEIKDSDNNEKGEEAEIPVIYKSSLAESKKNLFQGSFLGLIYSMMIDLP